MTESGGFGQDDHKVLWPAEGNQIFIRVITASNSYVVGRTYVIPLPAGQALPQIPVGGFKSEAEIAGLRGSAK